MGTGYVRNDTSNNISDNNVIDAGDLDGEFDAIVAAFNETTGHTHDGTSAEGGPITVVGPTQNVSISGTVVEPSIDDTVSLGSASKEFKNLYIDGTANIDSLVADTADINAGTIDNTVIGGTTPAAATVTTMTTTGAGTVGTTLDVTGATTLGSTLDVTGATTVDDLTATGTTTLAAVDINGGAIDGVTIGAASAGAGTFTTLTGTTTVIGTNGGGSPTDATFVAQANNPTMLFVDSNGTAKATRIRPDNAFNIDKVDDTTYALTSNMYSIPYDVSGATSHKWRVGASDKMALTSTGLGIGTTSPSAALDVSGAGKFTGTLTVGGHVNVTGDVTASSITATGTATLATVDINAGAIDGTTIGASSAAAGTFTNLTSTGTSTHATVDINGGAIDGTVIGGSSAAAGSFTTLSVTGGIDANGSTFDGEGQTIADDAVGSFTPPKTGGFALITVDGETSDPYGTLSCFIWYDVGTSRRLEKNTGFSTVGGTLVDVTTADVTGTTGADGSILISAQPGVVKIENRNGVSHDFQVTWL